MYKLELADFLRARKSFPRELWDGLLCRVVFKRAICLGRWNRFHCWAKPLGSFPATNPCLVSPHSAGNAIPIRIPPRHLRCRWSWTPLGPKLCWSFSCPGALTFRVVSVFHSSGLLPEVLRASFLSLETVCKSNSDLTHLNPTYEFYSCVLSNSMN